MAEERGAAAIVWLVILLPLLWFAALLTMNYPSWVGSKGVDIQGAVQRAAKAAAYQITPESYANADPQIDPVKAASAARSYLAENLRLDPATLAPRTGSWLADAPSVQLAVANGPFPQTLQVPGHPDVRVTFPTAGVLLFLDGTVRTPGQAMKPVSVWAAARVYRQGGP